MVVLPEGEKRRRFENGVSGPIHIRIRFIYKMIAQTENIATANLSRRRVQLGSWIIEEDGGISISIDVDSWVMGLRSLCWRESHYLCNLSSSAVFAPKNKQLFVSLSSRRCNDIHHLLNHPAFLSLTTVVLLLAR